MPRHRSLNLRKFIKGIPEPLLKEYFGQKFESPDRLPLKTFDYDSIDDYFDTNQDDRAVNIIREEFTVINDICAKAMHFVIDAVKKYAIQTTGEESVYELAMNIFLNYQEAFDYAYDSYCLFSAPGKMGQYNISADNIDITVERINEFKKRISDFYSKQAKGRECIIRHYDENNEIIIVVIRGSYKRSIAEWINKEIKTHIYRPANEDILQFDKVNSVLSIKASYQKEKINYVKSFTEAILEDKGQMERLDLDKTYSLKPLQNDSFSFYGNELIESIELLEVRLRLRGYTKPDIVIKSSDVLRTLREDLPSISLNSGELVHAKFRFRLNIDGKIRNVAFEITPPNVTDLTRKKHAEIIGDYLKENRIKLV